MEAFIAFFENISAGLLLGGIVLFWVLEGILPLFAHRYQRVRYAGMNLFFTMTTMIVGFGLAGALLWASDFTSSREIVLLYLVDTPLWAQVIVGYCCSI